MTKVEIRVYEVLGDEHDYFERDVLVVPLDEFTQGAQFGEISEAKLYAMQVAQREHTRKRKAGAR